MFRSTFVPLITTYIAISCLCRPAIATEQKSGSVNSRFASSQKNSFRAAWNGKGRWIGPEWWANPLWDWERIGNGRVRAPLAGSRALSLLPFEIIPDGTAFIIRTIISITSQSKSMRNVPNYAMAGFGLGRIGAMPGYQSAAVYPRTQFSAVLKANGLISFPGTSAPRTRALSPNSGPITFTLKGKRKNKLVALTLTAQQRSSQVSISTVVPVSRITGSFALITHGNRKSAESKGFPTVIFSKFYTSGSMLKNFSGRKFGAIMWSQYTISKNILRLQAQLAPFDYPVLAQLTIRSLDNKKKYQTRSARSDKLSRTVRFTIFNWDSKQGWNYAVQVKVLNRLHTWKGFIRQEPFLYKPFKVAAFSCDHGYLFPQDDIVNHVRKQNPDFLFFAGDQIYESFGDFRVEQFANVEIAMLDFLQKWYLFGWVWRRELATRPSVIIPDDHDVFQGNLFGDGGKTMRQRRKMLWSSGGYLMPGPWVTAVERCNTGHLPPPFANFRTPHGLKPYYTSLTYSGVSMAVLEDRKFKTAPESFPKYARRFGAGGQLLGVAQEKFLAKWVNDWKAASMKIAFSQTIFCNAATHVGDSLQRGTSIQDSGAWPIAARNRAVRLLGKGNVLSIHGDQHLGILLRQGVNAHDDAGVSFMVPGTANGYPRAWWPGLKAGMEHSKMKFTGRFKDDAGHPVTVLAVGNPEPNKKWLKPELRPPLQLARSKGSGYGVIELNRLTKTAKFHLYRIGQKFDEFEGFPRKVFIGGRPKSQK